MKNEFEKLTGKEVSPDEYGIIEMVYAFHPSISNVEGKQQIADLYKIGGMPLMKNMLETAEIMKGLDDEEREIKAALQKIADRRELASAGELQYERCRKELQTLFDKAEEFGDWERQVAALTGRYDGNLVMKVRNDLKI